MNGWMSTLATTFIQSGNETTTCSWLCFLLSVDFWKLSLLVTVNTNKQSFSTWHRVTTYLRITTREERLNEFHLLNIYWETNISEGEIINELLLKTRHLEFRSKNICLRWTDIFLKPVTLHSSRYTTEWIPWKHTLQYKEIIRLSKEIIFQHFYNLFSTRNKSMKWIRFRSSIAAVHISQNILREKLMFLHLPTPPVSVTRGGERFRIWWGQNRPCTSNALLRTMAYKNNTLYSGQAERYLLLYVIKLSVFTLCATFALDKRLLHYLISRDTYTTDVQATFFLFTEQMKHDAAAV
jgi:hypothetical protein